MIDSTDGSASMESKNLALGVLTTTAVILLVGILIVSSRPAPVLADGMTVAKGDYIITVGSGPQVDEEYVYIIDVPEQKLIAYRFNTPRQQIEVVQGLELAELREAGTQARPGIPQRRP